MIDLWTLIMHNVQRRLWYGDNGGTEKACSPKRAGIGEVREKGSCAATRQI